MNQTAIFHILVVEDDIDVRDAIADALEFEGYSVATASDGIEAFKYLESPRMWPDLILLDLMMPRMDGREFRAAQLKDPRFASIPVAVCTADGHADYKGSQLGAVGAFRKPLPYSQLIELIERLAERKRED
jgi:CheY-like chemotaxis protein